MNKVCNPGLGWTKYEEDKVWHFPSFCTLSFKLGQTISGPGDYPFLSPQSSPEEGTLNAHTASSNAGLIHVGFLGSTFAKLQNIWAPALKTDLPHHVRSCIIYKRWKHRSVYQWMKG